MRGDHVVPTIPMKSSSEMMAMPSFSSFLRFSGPHEGTLLWGSDILSHDLEVFSSSTEPLCPKLHGLCPWTERLTSTPLGQDRGAGLR